jgi:hypothetical protein
LKASLSPEFGHLPDPYDPNENIVGSGISASGILDLGVVF